MRRAAPQRHREHRDRTAAFLHDLQGRKVLAGFSGAWPVKPRDGLCFARGKVDRQAEGLGDAQQGVDCLRHFVEDEARLLSLEDGEVVHVDHLLEGVGLGRGPLGAEYSWPRKIHRGEQLPRLELDVEELLARTKG